MVHRVAALLQPFHYERGDLLVIFHNQYAQFSSIMAAWMKGYNAESPAPARPSNSPDIAPFRWRGAFEDLRERALLRTNLMGTSKTY